MKRKLLAMFLCICLIMQATIIASAQGTERQNSSVVYTVNTQNKTCTIKECKTSVKGQVTIPKKIDGYTVIDIYHTAFTFNKGITSFKVASGHKYYTAVDGVLFTKDKKELVAYPRKKTQTKYTVPSSVKTQDNMEINGYNVELMKAKWNYAEKPSTRVAKPVVKISTNAETGKPTLSWKKITGASKYVIYRATDEYGPFTKLYTTTKTTYTNTNAKVGEKYYYKVKAISKNKNKGDSFFSTAKYVTCDLKTPVVTITISEGKPMLDWKHIKESYKYSVYRSDSETGTYTRVYTTLFNSHYLDKKAEAGKTYYYKVKAFYEETSAANSAYSKVQSIFVPEYTEEKDEIL